MKKAEPDSFTLKVEYQENGITRRTYYYVIQRVCKLSYCFSNHIEVINLETGCCEMLCPDLVIES